MAANFVINVTQGDSASYFVSGAKRTSFVRLLDLVKAMLNGGRPTTHTWDVRNAAAPASGTVTISGGSGSITGTINGVGIAVTWATSDANTATLLAAAINASVSALVANIVTATAASNVVTITSVLPGVSGNCVTLAASGTGATASGARLTGGSETQMTFSF